MDTASRAMPERSGLIWRQKSVAIAAGLGLFAACASQPREVDPHSDEGLKRRFSLSADRIGRINCKTTPKAAKEFEFKDPKATGAFVIDVIGVDNSHMALHLKTDDGKAYKLTSYKDVNKGTKEVGVFKRDGPPVTNTANGAAVRVGHDTDLGEKPYVDFEVVCL